MRIVSVVVPIYNAAPFLDECIESILSQSYAALELILVNDGSTDGSSGVARTFVGLDKRVKLIEKKNEGVSVARNTGLKIAKGKYVVFIDADDYVDSHFIHNLVQDIEQTKVLVVTTAKAHVLEGEAVQDIEILHSKDAIERMYYGSLEKSDNGVQLFDRELLIKNSIFFDSKKKIGEDFDFFARVLLKTDKVAVDYRKMYYYRPNPNSAMNQKVNKDLMASVSGFSTLGESLVAKWPDLRPAVDAKKFGDSVSLMMRSYHVRDKWADDYERLEYNTRSLKWAVLANKRVRNKVRIAAMAYCFLGNRLATVLLRRMKK